MSFTRFDPIAQAKRNAARRKANLRALCRPLAEPSGAVMGGTTAGPKPKDPELVRDESYRRLVAMLPCYECRIQGYSQAAHPNSGKAKGVKLGDDGCFPLCVDRPRVKGCHPKFDQYEIVSAANMPEYERKAQEWTREMLRTTGATA